MRKISEMTLEELWQLFPIVLTEHQKIWAVWYEEEKKILEDVLSTVKNKRVSHIGSTAVQQIWAKPIIDILIELSPEYDMTQVKNILIERGYTQMSQSECRISLNKGYSEFGFEEKVYHVHLRYFGDNNAELYFRDYLNAHPKIAKQYESLKKHLWKQFEHNRDGYTEAKSNFILEYTSKAKELYSGRY